MSRHFWVLVHRYTGLSIAFFLIIAGLTGSVLAFYHELNDWLNPPGQIAVQAKPMLDPFDLRDLALAIEPNMYINSLNLAPKPGDIYTPAPVPRTDPDSHQPYQIKGVMLNPYTGAPVTLPTAEPPTGYRSLIGQTILPFIYELHYSLKLGTFGLWLFGIAATIWTLDCFVGFYLTLPMMRQKKRGPLLAPIGLQTVANQPGFWQRWQLSWKIKWPSSTQRLNFDLHRAGGLWTWVLLLMFAWSGVLLNLNEAVYRPVMGQFFEMTEYKNFPAPALAQPRPEPALDFRAAYQLGKRLMAEQARQNQFTVLKEQAFNYNPALGLYQYVVMSDRDIGDHAGISQLWLDGNSGALVRLLLPTGAKLGDTLTVWLINLHTAQIWGLPYKLLVCFLGLAVVMLSGTGIYLWLKKRQAADIRQKKHPKKYAAK